MSLFIGNKRQVQPFDCFLTVKGQVIGIELNGVGTNNPTYFPRCVLNSSGNVSSLVGPQGDTISVGGGGGLTTGGVTGASITGAMDGTNDTYTLPAAPAGGFAIGFFNTQPLVKGVDYTLTGTVVVFTTIRPNTANNDSITFYY